MLIYHEQRCIHPYSLTSNNAFLWASHMLLFAVVLALRHNLSIFGCALPSFSLIESYRITESCIFLKRRYRNKNLSSVLVFECPVAQKTNQPMKQLLIPIDVLLLEICGLLTALTICKHCARRKQVY
jgi:hypothetical protein